MDAGAFLIFFDLSFRKYVWVESWDSFLPLQ